MTLVVPGNDVTIGDRKWQPKLEPAIDVFSNQINPQKPYFYKPEKEAEWLKNNPHRKPEAFSHMNAKLISAGGSNHALSTASNIAFSFHLPLVLRPDTFWITLTQGLAKHINANAETLRKKFVSHEGQKTIRIRRDSFVKGSPDNDWQGAFAEFSERIKENIGDVSHGAIVADFTTTDAIAKAASEVVLMDAMKAYFKYEVMTLCGIPEFHIEGTREDWLCIQQRVAFWETYGLDFWVPSVIEILDEILAAFDGKPNPEFWRNWYKEEDHGSGGPDVNGFMQWMFPYVEGRKEALTINTNLGNRDKILNSSRGYNDSSWPVSMSKAPFIWIYHTEEFKMEFMAGLIGVSQRDNLAVEPVIGWAIADAVETKE